MASPPKHLSFIHRNDPGWIIQLWLAIHHGDPAPEVQVGHDKIAQAATEAIKALAQHIDPAKAKAVTARARPLAGSPAASRPPSPQRRRNPQTIRNKLAFRGHAV